MAITPSVIVLCCETSVSGGSFAERTCSFTATCCSSMSMSAQSSLVEQRAAPHEQLRFTALLKGTSAQQQQTEESATHAFSLFRVPTNYIVI